ncbi:amidase domain-containing protein [Siminovitchia sp. 179-K 8D1 HS]|uniref:amidase domain-containing protein n=1 Tax=Siminovitchia sp. 179-K 8D1 HS TaxID=3142385 RepID=UPI0039A05BED
MRDCLENKLEERVEEYAGRKKSRDDKVNRKLQSLANRKCEIVKVDAVGQVLEKRTEKEIDQLLYHFHFKYVIKQGSFFYMEEEVEKRKAAFYKNHIIEDDEVPVEFEAEPLKMDEGWKREENEPIRYDYDRLEAVRYAERWWNDYNPAYIKFEVDCTNYVSQCLHAGGAPMRGYPNRSNGWWYRNRNWSFSWSVANALKAYLQHSKTGLRAKEVDDPLELQLGDVICYDFQGDGRFDHNTIVTGKDANGMPLVNAHTYNTRMRYWAYEDSSAYTPNIQYKMFTIVDNS